MTAPTDEQVAAGLSEAGRDTVAFDEITDATLNRIGRAAQRGTGCRLTADMVHLLSVSILGEAMASAPSSKGRTHD